MLYNSKTRYGFRQAEERNLVRLRHTRITGRSDSAPYADSAAEFLISSSLMILFSLSVSLRLMLRVLFLSSPMNLSMSSALGFIPPSPRLSLFLISLMVAIISCLLTYELYLISRGQNLALSLSPQSFLFLEYTGR